MTIAPVMKRIIRSESFRGAAILIGVLHVCFLPCIWGNKSLLASAQDVPSIMPTGAWAGPPSAFRFSKALDNGGGGVFGGAADADAFEVGLLFAVGWDDAKRGPSLVSAAGTATETHGHRMGIGGGDILLLGHLRHRHDDAMA